MFTCIEEIRRRHWLRTRRENVHRFITENPFSFILGFTAFFSSISTIGKAITRYVGHKSNCQSVSPNLSNRKLPPPSPSSRGKWSATFHCSFYSLFFLFFPSLFFIFSFFSLFYSRSYRVMKNKSLDSGSGLWHFGKLLKPLVLLHRVFPDMHEISTDWENVRST